MRLKESVPQKVFIKSDDKNQKTQQKQKRKEHFRSSLEKKSNFM